MTKYKKGDEVTVRARVQDTDYLPTVGLTFTDGGLTAALYLSETQIATHTPKPRELEVGDVVGLEGAPLFHRTIIGLHGEWAWLSSGDGAYVSVKKIQIVRA